MILLIFGAIALLARIIFGAPFAPKPIQVSVTKRQGELSVTETVTVKPRTLWDVLFPWAILFWVCYFAYQYYLNPGMFN